MCSEDGTFLQEYFVYCKKKFLNQGTNYPSDAADVLCGVVLITSETSAEHFQNRRVIKAQQASDTENDNRKTVAYDYFSKKVVAISKLWYYIEVNCK